MNILKTYLFCLSLLLLLASETILAQEKASFSPFNAQEKQWIKDHPVIKVGIDANWPPIDFINESGQHEGITHDFIELISRQTGIQFSAISAGSWNDMLQKAQKREIDIVSNLAKRAEREKYWIYSQPYFQAPYVILTRKEQNNFINLDSLKNKIVAVEEGYNFHSELQKNHPQINLLVVKDTAAALRAVSRNQADAYIGNQAVIFYLAEKNRLTNLQVKADSGYSANKLYFGIRTDWPELVSIINKVLQQASTTGQAQQIERQWLGLKLKPFIHPTELQLTTEESAWLSKQSKLTIAVMDDWPPFNFQDNNGTPTGIGADIIKRINLQLGNKLTIVPGKWASIYKQLEQQKLDLIMDITPKKEREKYFNFTSPYLDIPHVFVAKKTTPFIKSEASLGGYSVALESGFGNVKYFRENYPEIKLKLFKDTREALEAVSRGEADAYAGNRVVALYFIEKLALSNLSIHGRLSKPGSILAIGSRKNAPILRDIIQKALNNITQNGLRDITNNWIYALPVAKNPVINFSSSEREWLASHPVIPVGIDGNWPPIDFIDEKNEFKGITADYLNLISQKTSISFKPEKSSAFKIMLQKVMNGELNVGATIAFNKDRTEKLLFTKPFFHAEKIIITRKDITDIRNINDLKGRSVAIEDGFVTMKILQEKHPEIKLIPVKSTLEALQKVSWGNADAYVGNQAVVSWITQKHQLTNLKITGNPGLGQAPQNFAVSKKDPDWFPLIGIIDKVLDSISQQERLAIENKWLTNSLRNYDIPLLKLNKQEKAWLKKHPDISLGIDKDWNPLEFIDDNNHYSGLSSDFMQYFSQQTGIKFKPPERMPWMMVIKGLQDKTIDIAPMVVKTEKRTEYLNFTEPYIDFPIVIFNRRGETLLAGITDLEGKKVGLVNGYAIEEKIQKDYPGILLKKYLNTNKGLKGLATGEVEAFIDTLAVGGYLIAAEGMTNLQVAASTQYNYPLSIGIRKDWPELISIFNKAINQLPAEKKNEFLKNWLVVHQAQKINYSLVLWVLAIAFIIFIFLGYRHHVLSKVNSELREGRERLALTLESAELGTWEMTFANQKKQEIHWDETFARHHSLADDQDTLNDDDIKRIISKEYADKTIQSLKRYIKGEQNEFKVEYLTRPGHRWIASQGRILQRNHQGHATRVVGISQDITENKEASLQIERSSHFKSQFLANMSHEIRTPMNAIVGLGHLLSKTDIDEKQADYINSLQKSSQTLLALIDDILDLSKIEAGHLNIENIRFNLQELLNDLTSMTIIRIDKKVEFIYELAPDVPDFLMGDPFRINQILNNLVSNAIKFTESGNIILHVFVKEPQQDPGDKIYLQFEVSDTGIGIAPDKLETLFDPFVQEDGSTTRKYGGTGLGLSISRQLASLMGGTLDAKSTQGKGSTFYFRLPFVVADQNSDQLKHNYPAPYLTGLNVLVVDDNPLSLKILTGTLESMTFHVTAISSGKEAMKLLLDQNTKKFDVVLLDWKMPDMDGEKTSIQIRKQVPENRLPIIILMTAYGREATLQKINHLPLDGYLVKPITSSQLFNAIIQAKKGLNHQQSTNTKLNRQNSVDIPPLDGHVLLAEDNKINQQVAQEILQQMGLKVSICENGQEVLQSLNKFIPDLILMDIQMPEMDGYQATQEIRKNPDFKQLPVIAMTANAMAEDIQKSLQSGMNNHINKPVDPKLLYETLSMYLPVKTKIDKIKSESESNAKTEELTSLQSLKHWPDSVPGLNIKQGIKQVGGNEKLYQSLLRDFVQNHGDFVENLEKSLQQGDRITAERLVHTIKGISGNIKANELMQITTEIDSILKNQETPAVPLMSTLKDVCDELFSSLELLVKQSQQPQTNHPAEQTVKQDDFESLNHALQIGDSRSQEIIQQMAEKINNKLGEKAVQILSDLVANYEFEQAQEWLQKALERDTNE